MKISRAAYYRYATRFHRPVSERELGNRRLEHEVQRAFQEHKGRYGRPRIEQVLRRRGHRFGANRIRKTMDKLGLQAKIRKKLKRTTLTDERQVHAPHLLKRNFTVQAPNRVWASDLTYVRTQEGWLYLAVVLDLYSRKVVGWSMASHMKATLVTNAINMAMGRRAIAPGVMFHSDRGSQYGAKKTVRLLQRHGFLRSMSKPGCCFDNAVVESFNDKLKQELIHRFLWPTRKSAIEAVAEYIERFYNPKRLHSTLGTLSPNEYELTHSTALAA